ncbi:hypothetical protein GCM10019016_083570 [Streptomyces prasinosporus]|uniref:Uncharacterized protein n=1 Tax=Streptomyces prasinosporus TaxID=68256 RepID=A0ABP6U0U8_9ACTN
MSWWARAANALVIVTYNGSDFESKKAPSTEEINKGAIKAAKEAVARCRRREADPDRWFRDICHSLLPI